MPTKGVCLGNIPKGATKWKNLPKIIWGRGAKLHFLQKYNILPPKTTFSYK